MQTVLENSADAPFPAPLSFLPAAWEAARRSVLQKHIPSGESLTESQRVGLVEQGTLPQLLREIFDAGYQVGKAAAQNQGAPFSIEAIQQVLGAADIPCMKGSWRHESENKTYILKRVGCAVSASASVCDYWREAVDGLVMGLGDRTRFVRVQSLGHLNPLCLDSLSDAQDQPRYYAPVPPRLSVILRPIVDRLSDGGVEVLFQGVAEDRLYYVLSHSSGPACSSSATLLRELVAREVAQLVPGLCAIENSPIGVIRE